MQSKAKLKGVNSGQRLLQQDGEFHYTVGGTWNIEHSLHCLLCVFASELLTRVVWNASTYVSLLNLLLTNWLLALPILLRNNEIR